MCARSRLRDGHALEVELSISEPPRFFEAFLRGRAASEAPRGSLYHRCVVDESGLIVGAKIVPPTSQNQKTIEGRVGLSREVELAVPRAIAAVLAVVAEG